MFLRQSMILLSVIGGMEKVMLAPFLVMTKFWSLDMSKFNWGSSDLSWSAIDVKWALNSEAIFSLFSKRHLPTLRLFTRWDCLLNPEIDLIVFHISLALFLLFSSFETQYFCLALFSMPTALFLAFLYSAQLSGLFECLDLFNEVSLSLSWSIIALDIQGVWLTSATRLFLHG